MRTLYKTAKIMAGLALAGASLYAQDKGNLEQKFIQSEQITEANRLLREFPKEIPGAKTIDKYETPGAQYTLVHIRQTHGLPRYLEDIIEKNLDKEYSDYAKSGKKDSQQDIYDILSFLSIKNDLKVVYVEGKVLGRSYNSDAFDGLASNKLLNEGKIILGPSENGEIYDKVAHFARNPGLRENMSEDQIKRLEYLTMDGREYEALKILSMPNEVNKGPMRYLVYGGAHRFNKQNYFRGFGQFTETSISWDNNISKWNEKYPDKKFSFIEITPNSYVEGPEIEKK